MVCSPLLLQRRRFPRYTSAVHKRRTQVPYSCSRFKDVSAKVWFILRFDNSDKTLHFWITYCITFWLLPTAFMFTGLVVAGLTTLQHESILNEGGYSVEILWQMWDGGHSTCLGASSTETKWRNAVQSDTQYGSAKLAFTGLHSLSKSLSRHVSAIFQVLGAQCQHLTGLNSAMETQVLGTEEAKEQPLCPKNATIENDVNRI